ncbi:MAG TPA: TSUP family transporter [bacterium]|nr:TSUP family transporter [bacterium]
MEPLVLFFLSTAGFAAGLIDSIAGGGGLVSLPALLAAGLPPQVALGTNKFQSMCGTAFALANFHRKGKVLWVVAAAGIPAALVGSAAGARLALILPPDLLGRALVLLLPPAAAAVLFSRTMMRGGRPLRGRGIRFWTATIISCSAVGVYDGFFGPGTGTFFIIALVAISRIPLINATATAKTFNLATNAGALAIFVIAGSVDFAVAAVMAASNVAGNLVGSHYALKHGAPLIRKILLVSLSLLFGYLVWKYYL